MYQNNGITQSLDSNAVTAGGTRPYINPSDYKISFASDSINLTDDKADLVIKKYLTVTDSNNNDVTNNCTFKITSCNPYQEGKCEINNDNGTVSLNGTDTYKIAVSISLEGENLDTAVATFSAK